MKATTIAFCGWAVPLSDSDEAADGQARPDDASLTTAYHEGESNENQWTEASAEPPGPPMFCSDRLEPFDPSPARTWLPGWIAALAEIIK